VSAKGERPTGPPRGRRGYTVARPRSNTWLWILNAIVISVVVIAAAAVSTSVGHTVVSALNRFLLFYAGVLALVALTAEVGIGLVASDRIIMKPSARVTTQAIHRAMGFGAIAFLVIHIALEIVAGRSHTYDAVVPFLDKSKTFYLGLGTVASDMFIVIMMTGIYRARLATSMSPNAWRVIHGSAYVAWIFGVVHGLLGGRAAKAFFGYSGFVYWAYGACAAAVAVALMMRLAAQHRASNDQRSQPVSDTPTGAGWPAAALASGALPRTVMSATGIGSGAQTALEGRPAAARRAAGLGQRSRPQLALPAGRTSGQPSGSARTAQHTGAAQNGHTRQYGRTGQFSRTGPFDQLGGGHPSGPMPQFGADHPSGPFDRPQFDGSRYERTGEIDQSGRPQRHMMRGQSDWIAAYERPLGAQRPVLPADHPSASFDRPQFGQRPPAPSPPYEMTGEIDRPALYQPILPAEHPSAPLPRPQFDEPAGYDPRDRAAVPYQQAPVPYQRQVPWDTYAQPMPPGPRDAYGHYAQDAPPPQAGGPGQHRPGPHDPAAGLDQREPSSQFERSYVPGPSAPYGQPGSTGPVAGHHDALDLAARQYEQRSQPDPRDRYAQYAEPASQYGEPAYADPRDQAGSYGPAGDYRPPSHYAQPPEWDPRAAYDQGAHAERSAQFDRDRAAHYTSFADQDASYTRPRPPGAGDHFGPQDDTDPLNIVPLNTGDYS
jgi:Ferric reductase like transmembrane component